MMICMYLPYTDVAEDEFGCFDRGKYVLCDILVCTIPFFKTQYISEAEL